MQAVSRAANRIRRALKPRVRSRGQALVEFALTLPILLLLTVGVIDLSRGVYYFNTLSNAAREGARFGIVLTDSANGDWWADGNLGCVKSGGVCIIDGGTGDPKYNLTITYNNSTTPTVASLAGSNTIVGHVLREAGMVDRTKVAVTINVNPASVTPGLSLPLKVTVDYQFKPIVAYVIGSPSIDMRGASMMRTQSSSTY
ncbi:MAG: TadE/TadG family type IV pilus assembly protein [Chloroflexota bacterium]